MKRNHFGELRFTPGDDLMALWNDEFTPEEVQPNIYARDLDLDSNFGWTCSLNDDDGNESECHDFESEDDLRRFLDYQGVSIVG